MRATRRLDILAIIGGLLAVIFIIGGVVLISQFVCKNSQTEDTDKTRALIMARIPDSDIRADFAILSSSSDMVCPKAYLNRREIVADAIKKFPSSARIQFRAGTVLEGSQSIEALRKASELDTTNALPLYLLAADAAERQATAEAVSLTRRANQRKDFTEYPLPTIDIGAGVSQVSAMLLESATEPKMNAFQSYGALRSLTRALCNHAMALQKSGKTDEALQILGDVKQMARAQLHRESANAMDVMTGATLLKIALASEQKMLKATGDQSKQAKISQELRDTQYLYAGAKISTSDMMSRSERDLQWFFSPPIMVAPIIIQIWFSLVVLAIFACLAVRSRNKAASESHIESTEKAFSIARLLKLYVLVFIPLGILASLAFFYIGMKDDDTSIMPILAITAIVPSILLHWGSAREYKRAYIDTGTPVIPKPWKGAPIAEKREAARRLSGIHGGAVVFLVALGLLVSAGVKLSFNAYPWQPNSLLSRNRTYEKTYVQDLLAGKIKLSEKTIRDNNPQPKREGALKTAP